MFSALPLKSEERNFQKVLTILISLLTWGEENRSKVITDGGKTPATPQPFSKASVIWFCLLKSPQKGDGVSSRFLSRDGGQHS